MNMSTSIKVGVSQERQKTAIAIAWFAIISANQHLARIAIRILSVCPASESEPIHV
jgi:hypothetical protein